MNLQQKQRKKYSTSCAPLIALKSMICGEVKSLCIYFD